VRLLITGARGQLGRELVRHGGGHALLAVDHDHLDICDAHAVDAVCDGFSPDVIINAAAYTAVDLAESDRELAFAVNHDGPKNLALAAESAGIPLIHVSTDYVFDGSKQGPYVESDPIAPLGVYGESKLAGEQAVIEYCSRHLILRTSWVFSAHGNNFVKTMLRLGIERQELGIVSDQHGCPTSANELARAIYAMCDAGLAGGLNDKNWGVYHFCQPEPTTWFDFAKAIFSEAVLSEAIFSETVLSETELQGIDMNVPQVKAIPTSDYPTPVKRPANSVMDCSKFEKAFGFTIRPWRDSLEEVVRVLKMQKN